MDGDPPWCPGKRGARGAWGLGACLRCPGSQLALERGGELGWAALP